MTLTAAVTSSSATGTVEFFEGSTELGTATLSSGTATYTTSALSTAGSYTFYAVYLGNSTYASSTSSTITVTVTSSSSSGTATTTTLSIAPSSKAWVNSMVVMTATVASSSATGTVQFWGATSSSGTYSELATATLSSGSATAVTSFSSTRTEFIYAVYVGDSTYASSTSSTSSLTIATPSDSLDFSTYSCTSKSASITTYSSASDTTGTTQTVTYCLYSNVIYAANPDNSSYESMSVYVPTKIGSTSVSVSSSSTPILIENCNGGYMGCTAGSLGTNGDYFLANGYVVVEVGARGRNVADSSGVYGVAPAGIVDLKAAVRFIRHNSASDSGSGSFPGDTDLIFSSGGSAGGAMSSLLGASGNSTLYYSYLAAIGAANANDNVYAVIAYSPITNLDHADMAYEYEYGSLLSSSCSSISSSLQGDFETYQNDLGFSGSSHSSAHSTSSYPYGSTTTYSTLTSSSITPYLLNTYLIPSAEMYLASLSSSSRTSYLSSNSWITYTSSSGAASFTFANYVADGIGTRSKAVPAFDSFYGYSSALSCENTSETAEINEFGDGSSSSAYAHFTDFSSEATGGSAVSTAMQTRVNMMNPMYFITTDITNLANSESTIADVPKFWYIRDGSIATDTSIYVIMDLATGVETLMGNYYSGSTWSVNAWENWGAGHNQNVDPWDLMTWVKSVI